MLVVNLTEIHTPRSSANTLAKKISLLPGVGEKTADALMKTHISSIFELLLRVPKSVVEQEDSPGFAHMEPGRTYIAKGKVIATKITGFTKRRRLEAILQDETGRMSAVFFGPAVNYAQQILKNEATVTLTGEAKDFLGRIQMVHPKLVTNSNMKTESNVAAYSQVGGLTPAIFKRIVDKALALVKHDEPGDHALDHFLEAHHMTPLRQALIGIHEPKDDRLANWDDRKNSPYFRRLAFEELLSFYLRLNLERSEEKRKTSVAIPARDVESLATGLLPFPLTDAQQRVIKEILEDMTCTTAMTRLLQGDVGSGKTAVSAVFALHAAMAGLQVAVMAPTEILAEQLFRVYQGFFSNKKIEIALLTASTKSKDRKHLVERIAAHEIAIVVGTHALLSDDVNFNCLGLVIIDEQHRFGVKQRAELIKGCGSVQNFSPHLLVMSATPIPRSLALTLYGDLELSVIDERPPGRLPVHTQILAGPVLESVERLCQRILVSKQKAFIVFPLVEESENLDLEHATKALALLQRTFGKNTAMLLHGRMKPEEKAQAMDAFRKNAISFLVATTVVEVGVDVPDATCMVIVHPERFGLAQLHQLRGRVGRKDLKSFCFLVTDVANKFGTAYQRLTAMCKTDNGFKLAEIDLEIRGPGELLGTKQSGLPNFLIFNHSDFADLVSPAKAYAKAIANSGPHLGHLHLYSNQEAHFS